MFGSVNQETIVSVRGGVVDVYFEHVLPELHRLLTAGEQIVIEAIADYLGRPLAKLTLEQMETVNSILEKTLSKQEVMAQIRAYFSSSSGRSPC